MELVEAIVGDRRPALPVATADATTTHPLAAPRRCPGGAAVDSPPPVAHQASGVARSEVTAGESRAIVEL
jgi:hypothetical protein